MLIVVTILGLAVGSFLNVCIYRIPLKETVVYKSSSCPHCSAKLKVVDLVPLISYVALKGKCRYCKKRISLLYPSLELLTAVTFVASYLLLGNSIFLVKYLFLFSVLIIITFVDLEYQAIPNNLIVILLLWATLWQLLYPEISLGKAFSGAALGGGLLLLIAVISKGGMGGGDIKLMFVMGLYLGLSLTALALFLGFLSGSVIGLILIVLRYKTRKDPIPFAPFLTVGIISATLWGYNIIDYYINLF